MQNILVTGAAGGIGQAITFDLLAHGYNVVAVDNNDENLRDLRKRYREFAQEETAPTVCGTECFSREREREREQGAGKTRRGCGRKAPFGASSLDLVQMDVTDVDALKAFAKGFSEDTRISHIVSLAGRALQNEWMPFWQQDLEEIKMSLLVNLFGHINIIHTFLPALLNSGDDDMSVTLVSSINALSNYGLPAYSAAKSGMYGLINALCKEFGVAGIRINTISPGTIVTEATQAEPKDFEGLKKKTALGRFATKGDIAKTVRFLITNSGITGQNITVDAGQVRI